MKLRYWKCTKALSAKIEEFQKEHAEMLKRYRALAKSIGADPKPIAWKGKSIVGFVFKSDPGKGFRRCNKFNEPVYIPTTKSLKAKLAPLFDSRTRNTEKLIGYSSLHFYEGDFWQTSLGVYLLNGIYYISTHDEFNPEPGIGLRRISDLTFEKMKAGKKR